MTGKIRCLLARYILLSFHELICCATLSMITASVFIGSAPLHDFVSVTFLPLVPLIVLGYWLLKSYYNDLLF